MKQILVIDTDDIGNTSLLHQMMLDKHSDDIIVVTPEEAKEQGLPMDAFTNLPVMKITAPQPFAHLPGTVKSGKENRRERRAKERKSKKKRK